MDATLIPVPFEIPRVANTTHFWPRVYVHTTKGTVINLSSGANLRNAFHNDRALVRLRTGSEIGGAFIANEKSDVNFSKIALR